VKLKEKKAVKIDDKNLSKEVKVKKEENITLNFVLPNVEKIKAPKKHIIKKTKEKVKNKKINKKPKNESKKIVSKKSKLDVIKVKKVDINELILVYNKNPNYNLAMTISKEYLKRKNYDKAQIWAIKANTIDPKRPDSWIEFADILIKKGQKQKAIEVLKTYLDSYGYNEVIEKKIRMLNE